jgi:spermidine synthase
MAIQWTRMNTLLEPRTGKRFALVRDFQEDTIILIDLQRHYVVMSDSNIEKEFNAEIVEKAYGDILLLGFGIGFILQPLMKKPEVTSITVIEAYQEVLDICASQLVLTDKVRIILSDATLWQPDMMFDVIYDDCDYSPELLQGRSKQGVNIDAEERLTPWLKPDGLFIRWTDDGRYTV